MKLKRILAVVLALTMVLSTMSFNVFAEGVDTSGDVINVTASNAQDVLDGMYGSINGKTINFTESIGVVLDLARPTKHAGSNTTYECGDGNSHSGVSKSFTDVDEFLAHYGENEWHATANYYRTLENVTFTANEGVTLAGFEFSTGHMYDSVYDYVKDTTSAYYDYGSLNGITFKGLTVTGHFDAKLYAEESSVENITFDGCTFTGTTDDGDNAAIKFLADNQYFADVAVTDCTIDGYFQGVYVGGANGVTISNNSISNTEHNAIALQSNENTVKGEVVVEENYITNVSDRAIRFNAIGDADITINNNIMVDCGNSSDQLIKAESIDEAAEIDLESNYWDGTDVSTAVASFTAPTVVGITGGTWDVDVSSYVAKGYELNKDGTVEEKAVATVNDVKYGDIQEAIKAAAPSGTVEIVDNIVVDEWVMISETLSIGNGNIITLEIDGLTINGNDHTLTINSIESAGNGGYLFYDATKLNINDLTINYADGLVGGIGLASGTISNVTFNGGIYGVFPQSGDVVIEDCTFKTNGTSIYFDDARNGLTVTGCTFENAADVNVILLRGNVNFTNNNVISGRTVNVVSGSPVVTGNDFNNVRFKVYNEATATVKFNEINVLAFNDETKVNSTFSANILSADAKTVLEKAQVKDTTYVALGDVNYSDIYKALDDATDGSKISLLGDLYISESLTIKEGMNITLDLNGATLAGLDTATASFGLINIQPGASLTIEDTSSKGTGKITLKAENERNWNAYSSVISNQRGKLTVNSGTIEHLGGTAMAYGIDNLTNGKNTYAETVINGGTVKSTYRAIRQFLNGVESENILTIDGGTIEGANRSVWMQDASKAANSGTLTVAENANIYGNVYLFVTAGSTEWPVEVSIDADALKDGSEVTVSESNVPEGYTFGKTNGVYGVEKVVEYVASIGDDKYETLQAAFDAAEDADTITVLKDITIDETTRYNLNGYYEGIYYSGDKSFTVDLGGYTITQDGTVNDYLILLNNNGEKANTITFKNGTIDAGTTAYCALCTAKSNAQEITVNLENINLVGNNSNGAVVKVRGGTLLNVNDGTTITGKDNYVGIEAVGSATVVNIYDGAKIYQNGTTSNWGSLAGVSSGATLNAFGGEGESAKGGFIAMTSGGTINVKGGEWTADSGKTGYDGNHSVLIAQSNKTYTESVGNSVINVSGGQFTGKYNCYGDAEGDAQINISGGTFTVDPTKYVTDDYEIFENADGTYTVGGTVAKIEDVKYYSLANAVKAAKSGDTIELVADVTEDVTIDKSITIDGSSAIEGQKFNYTGKMTVSNGMTVTIQNVKFQKGCIDKTRGTTGELEIKNCEFDGVDKSINYAVTMRGGNAVKLENCTVVNYGYGMLYVPSGTTNVNVTKTRTSNVNYGVHVAYGTNVNLEDVTMENVAYGIMTQNYGAKNITLKNCNISGTNPIYVWERNTTVIDTFNFEGENILSGLTNSAQANLVLADTAAELTTPAGFNVTTSVDGYFVKYVDGVYKAGKAIAKIGNVIYESFAEAIAAANDGDTITLVSDVTASAPTVIEKSITLDGNGNTLTYTGSDRAIEMPNIADSDYDVTIKNLTVNFSGYSNRGINYNDNGTLTLDNVTVYGEKTTYALNFPAKSNNATVVINESDITGVIALNVWGQNMTITATDSDFTSIDNSAKEKYDAVKLNNDGTISAEGSKITITGGSITALNEKDEWSYAINNATSTGEINVSDTTTVVGNEYVAVAVIRYANQNEFYSAQTLQNAFDLAKETNAEKVALIRDIELEETVTVGEGYDIVLDLNGHTITNVATSTITIDGGTLTVKDSGENGAIVAANTTGGNDDKAAVLFKANDGKFVLESGTLNSTKYGVRSKNVENTKIVINGGTINADKDGTEDIGYGVYASSGSVTMNGGTINSGCWGIAAYGEFTMNGGKITAKIGYTSNGSHDNTEAVINDGIIDTTKYVGIYWPSAGSLTINGGSITGPNAVYVKSGSVAITDGTFVANGEKADYEFTASGFVETGDALAIENVGGDTGYEAVKSVSVTGGTFTSANASAVASYAATTEVPTAEAVTKFISGGVFSSDVSAYLAEGVAISMNSDKTYGVVAERKLEIEAVTNNDEDKVIADEEFTVTVKLTAGEDIVNAAWTLGYDTDLFELVGADEQTGKVNEAVWKSYAADGYVFAKDEVIKTYTFKAKAVANEVTGYFTLSDTTASTFAESRDNIKVAAANNDKAPVTIVMKDYEVSAKLGETDINLTVEEPSAEVTYNGTAYELVVTAIDIEAAVTYTVNGEAVENVALTDAGTYTVVYTIDAENGYADKTGTITITVKDPDFAVEVTAWTNAGKRLVLVYTNQDNLFFTYNDNLMIDVTERGYKYENTTKYKNVFAFVTDDLIVDEVDSYKANIKYLADDNGLIKLKLAAPEILADVNFSLDLCVQDISVEYGILNLHNEIYGDVKYQKHLLKGDVNGDKKVNGIDASYVVSEVKTAKGIK